MTKAGFSHRARGLKNDAISICDLVGSYIYSGDENDGEEAIDYIDGLIDRANKLRMAMHKHLHGEEAPPIEDILTPCGINFKKLGK